MPRQRQPNVSRAEQKVEAAPFDVGAGAADREINQTQHEIRVRTWTRHDDPPFQRSYTRCKAGIQFSCLRSRRPTGSRKWHRGSWPWKAVPRRNEPCTSRAPTLGALVCVARTGIPKIVAPGPLSKTKPVGPEGHVLIHRRPVVWQRADHIAVKLRQIYPHQKHR
jgi:hypothetical protein